MKVLILGATGLVGRNALAQLLAQQAVTQVIAPTRRPLPTQDKLTNPVAPKLERLLPEMTNWQPDAFICATGTTINKADRKKPFAPWIMICRWRLHSMLTNRGWNVSRWSR